MDELAGKVALITGSAGGIGLGIARAFASKGMRIVLSDVDEDELATAADGMASGGSDVMCVALDVTNREDWARAAEAITAQMGPVQVLVNNAGISSSGLNFRDIEPPVWDQVVSTNLTGAYNGIREFLDGMLALGSGHIVNTSSVAGLIPGPTLSAYAATKSALIALSESLRSELIDTGIGVSVLCAGPVRTRLWRTSRIARGLPDVDVPPEGLSGQSGRAEMLPDEVGRRVLRAVMDNDLYVITHPEHRPILEERHERMMRSFDKCSDFPKS